MGACTIPHWDLSSLIKCHVALGECWKLLILKLWECTFETLQQTILAEKTRVTDSVCRLAPNEILNIIRLSTAGTGGLSIMSRKLFSLHRSLWILRNRRKVEALSLCSYKLIVGVEKISTLLEDTVLPRCLRFTGCGLLIFRGIEGGIKLDGINTRRINGDSNRVFTL